MAFQGTGFKDDSIELDEPRSIYYAGQVLSGKIQFRLDQSLSFLAINVVYRGEAKVTCQEEQEEIYSGESRFKTVEYSGHEDYINFAQCVHGGHGTSVLPPGSHSIPFSYQIPHSVPSSYRGERGSITYRVAAYLELPNNVREEIVKEFEVVTPVDVNTQMEFREPISLDFEDEDTCCTCFYTPGALQISIKLPTAYYCSGQVIPITVITTNKSNIEVSKIIFQLLQKEAYRTQRPVSEYVPPEKVLATLKRGPILSHTKQTSHQFELRVPDMIVPNLDNSEIMDLGYSFKVKILLSGCNDDQEDEADICLGLEPLDKNEAYTHPMAVSLPTAPIPPPPAEPNPVAAEIQTNAAPLNSSYPIPSGYPYPTPNQHGNTPYETNKPNLPYPMSVPPYPTQSPYPMPNQGSNPYQGFKGPDCPYPGMPQSYPNQSMYPPPYDSNTANPTAPSAPPL